MQPITLSPHFNYSMLCFSQHSLYYKGQLVCHMPIHCHLPMLYTHVQSEEHLILLLDQPQSLLVQQF